MNTNAATATKPSIYVPSVNPKYVPWGSFELVHRVIASSRFAPVWITGESGNGKTFAVEQACAQLNRELIIINITNETSEEDLIGTFALVDGDKGPVSVWNDGPVITAMRHGAILCLDEVDQATPRILALQTILQGNAYVNKKTNEVITPKHGFNVIATANTKGNGTGTDKFIGAQLMNDAFLERFAAVIEQPYPPVEVETKIVDALLAYENFSLDKRTKTVLLDFVAATRKAMMDNASPVCITTRRLVQILQNIMILAGTPDKVTDDVKRKAVELACARFDKPIANALTDLYSATMK